MILTAEFFARPTLEVAPDLLGATLFVETPEGTCGGRIVEVEAYLGAEDRASHAARGPTPRSKIMFGAPGHAYVYLIYGMHHCLNFVTEPKGIPGAVLIRALEPVQGMDLMVQRRGGGNRVDLCNGPGKLCRALAVDLGINGLVLNGEGEKKIVLEAASESVQCGRSSRIGIKVSRDLPYRFFDPGSFCVSI